MPSVTKKLKLLYILLLFFAPVAVIAQVTITGKVISQTDTKPVAHASVFLSNATIGTSTADDGTFSLKNVAPGKYNLVVSILGFDETVTTLIVSSRDIEVPVITLFPKTVSLNAVTVSAKRNDPQWSRNYERFKEEFFGRTELSKECKILNPEVLQLHYDEEKHLLTASSSDFLEIENKALGYKIKYLLKEFSLDNSTSGIKALGYHGYTLFDPMNGTAAQQSEWKNSRAAAYEGSQMHFLRAVVNNATDEEGFRVVRLPLNEDKLADNTIYLDKKTYEALKQKVVQPVAAGPDEQGIYKLINNNDRLYISYNKYHHFSTSRYTRLSDGGNTLVDFTAKDALFDSNGALLDPKSIVYDGAWARNGVANLLPVDYADDGAKKVYATATIRELAKKLKTYADSIKTEKVYLHFDKPYYAINDTIYFKAYVTGGGNGRQLSNLSGILNADLIDPANKINRTIKLKLDNGIATGDFVLPDSLKSGSYRVRAYTNWMKNEGEGSFFEKLIPVGGIDGKRIPEGGKIPGKESSVTKITKTADVQFMPEGGSLVVGNYSKIAVKALGPDGLGKDFKGVVTDEVNEEVCRFESGHAGMGSFFLVPKEGKIYKAAIAFADGTSTTTELPKATNNGYTMTVNNASPDTLRIRIAGGGNSPMAKLGLVAQAGGQVYYAAENKSENKFFSVAVPKSKFPSGIIQFTLLSASGEPLNERLVFIEHPGEATIGLKADRVSYTTRQKVSIQVTANSEGRQAAAGNYSVAVIDEDKLPAEEPGETTILTSLLLTSDLKGSVEQPNYYFTDASVKTKADLDNLMLTQGYRRFAWKKVLHDNVPPTRYQPEKAMTITGIVKLKGKPAPAVKVTILSKSAGGLLKDTLSDESGRFRFDNLSFNENTKFVVQAKVAKGQDDVTVDLDTARAVRPATAPLIEAADYMKNAIVNPAYLENQRDFYREQEKYGINKHVQLLKEVTIRDKKEFTKRSANRNGAGNADRVITADDLKNLVGVTLSFRLNQKLFGDVKFINGVPYSMHSHMTPAPMLIIVDDQETDYEEYSRLDPDRVQAVEVLASPNYGTMYGTKGESGVLVVTTKRGKDYEKDYYYRYAPGVVTYIPTGFYKAREFYSPQYDNPHTNPKMADLRSTIYWNPNIITDKDGKASFSYFNADGKGTYRVVIEGIDADGNLGRQILRYKVE